ncbi:triose-phosphate isomerase [Prosthecochloris marina]|uniref:Triosephosphate isomerase n=1 Tax=Prosthecochloris marina TaxID=2017681 RepID=A0A317T763_9CHLB|nr:MULTISPECIES: triose-phosphate isomerase [Prosthecochloris]PWW82090.1 triose-phosphate isomerase [Prosthecochloris marina]UZJ39710.1 triose-phosphate isomerase [Prosthecochloris sp. SCSIO W1102]
MRKKIVVGNWKMNKTVAEASELASAILEHLGNSTLLCEVGIAPAFPALTEVGKVIGSSDIRLAAQNCHYEDDGAYTGEISVRMLESLGCAYVIIGHSERRQYFGETNRTVNLRVRKALAEGMQVIMCVGETLEEREGGITDKIVTEQVREGLKDVGDLGGVVLAYEPVWAIGTGKTATPEQAEEVHASIRATISDMFGESAAGNLRIQYGGSVKPSNAVELFAMPNIDGGLIGGASLKAEDFVAIVKAAG